MDKILKLNSSQGFSFSKAGNATTASKNLLDFYIPANAVYNLKDSFINVSVECDAPDATPTVPEGTGTSIIQFGIFNNLGSNTSDDRRVPNVALIKNAQMSSSNRGMMESIRRVNTLRCLQNQYLECFECKDGKEINNVVTVRDSSFTVLSPVRNVVKVNTLNGVIDTTQTTREVSHDIKIPLSHIFDLPNQQAEINTQIYGQIRMNLETAFDRLSASAVLGEDDAAWETSKGLRQLSAHTNPSGVATETLTYLDVLKTNYRSEDEIPFFVGQKLKIELNSIGAGGWAGITAADNVRRTITGIELLTSGKARLHFNSAVVTLPANAGFDVNVLTRINGCNPASVTIRVTGAEIVLKEVMNPAPSSDTIRYTTHTVEEDNGNVLTNFNKQYTIEPRCVNLLVALPDLAGSGGLISDLSFTSYRIMIDNIDQTQRDITQSRPLQYDRIFRAYENLGKKVKNITQKVRNPKLSPNFNAAGNALSGAHLVAIQLGIVEPMPVTKNPKLVNLNILSGGVREIILYKQVLREI